MSWFPHFYAPRKRAATIHAVYIADGVADDCEELIHRCCQVGTLNFNVFSNIWKDMNFAWIFQGRPSGAELAELSEEAIQVAKRYLIQNTNNFEETVASLFLIYALLHLQPIKRFTSLRITPEDLDAITRIKTRARQQRRHDVLYILAAVLLKGPCQFHVGEREYGMDTAVRKYFDSITSIDKYGTRPKGVFYRQTEELDLLRELSSLGRRYARAKTFDNNVVADRTLRYVDEHLPNELAATLKQLIEGDTSASKPQAVTVQSIKDRAMWHQIQEMRHLKRLPETTSKKEIAKKVRNRKKDEGIISSKSKPKEKNRRINSGLARSMSGSPEKPLPTNSKKAYNKPIKTKTVVSTSEDSDETSISSLDDNDTDNDTDVDTNDDTADEDDPEAHLNNLKTIDEYLNRIKDLPQTVTSDQQASASNSDSIQYEIEIIDYMQNDQSNINNSELENIDNDSNNTKTVNNDASKTRQYKSRKSLNMTDSKIDNTVTEPDKTNLAINNFATKPRQCKSRKSLDITDSELDGTVTEPDKTGSRIKDIKNDATKTRQYKSKKSLDMTDSKKDGTVTQADKTNTGIKDINNKPNVNERIESTKSKQHSNKRKITPNSTEVEERSTEAEQDVLRVTRNRVVRKSIDITSPPQKKPKRRINISPPVKWPKARIKAPKYKTKPTSFMEDTSSIDLPPPKPATSLPQLFTVDLTEDQDEDGYKRSRSERVVEFAVVKRRYKRKMKKLKALNKLKKSDTITFRI